MKRLVIHSTMLCFADIIVTKTILVPTSKKHFVSRKKDRQESITTA